MLDRWGVFRARLFRESCVFHRGNYVKDLNKLGRDLQQIIIVDNSPASYIFHPDNAVMFHLFYILKLLRLHGAQFINNSTQCLNISLYTRLDANYQID